MPHALRSLRRAAGGFARAFRRDEGGSMVVFAMFVMIMMLMVGGMAVDLMRFESARARLQATCDRGVLAAANLEQSLDSEAVVRDYFDRAGLLEEVTDVQVTETINSRSVAATARMDLDTYFMDLVGVDTLSAPADCTATEARRDIEIVLVLDVSYSMREASGGTTKIANLRAAAREFVSLVRANDTENRISIAVVPFNSQVNLGPTLFNAMVGDGWSGPADPDYNITHRHGTAASFCIDMPEAAFGSPLLPTAMELPQAGFFDGNSGTNTPQTTYQAPQANAGSGANMACRAETQNYVRLPAQNVTTLRSQLQGLAADGNTSITMGMKWAMTLLSPGMRPLYGRLIAAGQMPATLQGRPYDYDRPDTLKVIVVMTDGDHFPSRYLEDGYRTEMSNLWRTGTGTGATWSAYFDRAGTTLDYWVPSVDGNASVSGINGAWMEAPHNDTDTDGTGPDTDTDGTGPDTDTDGAGPPERLAWNRVWADVRVSWVAWTMYARALGTTNATRNARYDEWMGRFTGDTDVDDMDGTLQMSCAQAKANGIIVYGIAFEAPPRGAAQIYACASSPAHYYDPVGAEIDGVFTAIAGQISALRLSQ